MKKTHVLYSAALLFESAVSSEATMGNAGLSLINLHVNLKHQLPWQRMAQIMTRPSKDTSSL